MTSQLIEHSFDSQATRITGAWLIFLTCYPWVFVQPGMAEVRSTGARIKCLYCEAGLEGKQARTTVVRKLPVTYVEAMVSPDYSRFLTVQLASHK